MRINLYLDKPECQESYIMIHVTMNGFIVRTSSGVKINPKHCKLKGKRKIEKLIPQIPTYRANQAEIDKLCNYITDYVIDNNTRNQLTAKELKNAIDEFKKPFSQKKSSNNTIEYFKMFIAIRKNTDIYEAENTKPFSKSSIYHYNNTLDHLIDFYEYTKFDSSMEQFKTNRLWENFRSFLSKKNLHANTIGGHCKVLKTFGHWAIKQKLIPEFNFSQWKARKEETPMFALDDNELEILFNLDLESHEKLNNVRDIFLLQCFTGLRYSDLSRLQPNNIDCDKGEIRIKTLKTDASVIIPIIPQLKRLLQRKGEAEFRFICLQNYNRFLKELGKVAELNNMARLIKYENGRPKELLYKKSELLSSHCARRTFVTTALRLKIPQELIMKVTGHKTYASFQKYIKFTNDDVKYAFMEAFNKK